MSPCSYTVLEDPGEVSFDVPFQDCSWMVYLARAGYGIRQVDAAERDERPVQPRAKTTSELRARPA